MCVVFVYIGSWNVIGSCVRRRLYVCIIKGECINWVEEVEVVCFDKVFVLFVEGDSGVFGGLVWKELGSLIVMWISIVMIWLRRGGGKESSFIIVVLSNNWL